MSTVKATLLFALWLAVTAATCTYDPPPEVTITERVIFEGEPLLVSFSEPVDPATLAIRIWQSSERDREGEFDSADTPRLDRCTLAESPCGTTVVTLGDQGVDLVVTFDPEDLGQPDVPWVLEILPGLADLDGNTTGVSLYFDFYITPNAGGESATMQEGVYLLVADVEYPLSCVVILYIDIQVRDDGETAITCTKGVAIEGAPRNTLNPEEIEVDMSVDGFIEFVTGRVREVDGDRFLETDPFDMLVTVGPISVMLYDTVLNAIVVEETDSGHEVLEGAMSYGGLEISTGMSETAYPAGSESFETVFVEDLKIPSQAGRTCDPLCGELTIGRCDPPEEFPAEGYCDGE